MSKKDYIAAENAISYLEYLYPEFSFKKSTLDGNIVFTGVNTKKELVKEKILSSIQNRTTDYKGDWNEIPIGVDLDNREVFCDMKSENHSGNLLIISSNDEGRMNLNNLILRHFANNDTDVKVFLADINSLEYRRLESNNIVKIDDSYDLIKEMRKINNVINDRINILDYVDYKDRLKSSKNNEFDPKLEPRYLGDYISNKENELVLINDKVFDSYKDMITCLDKNNNEITMPVYELIHMNEKPSKILLNKNTDKFRIVADLDINKTVGSNVFIKPIILFFNKFERTGRSFEYNAKNRVLFESLLNKILDKGNYANVHVIISSDDATNISSNILNKFNLSLLNGNISRDSIKRVTKNDYFTDFISSELSVGSPIFKTCMNNPLRMSCIPFDAYPAGYDLKY